MPQVAVTLPYWLDRPAGEALAVVRATEAAGIAELWIGEMATFEAFALAGAVAASTAIERIVVGPLPLALRDPVLLAMGVATVSEVGGRSAHLALGASTPTVTAGWHGRPERPTLARFRSTLATLRTVLAGDRGPGGFRLRVDASGSSVALAAFGPRMLGVGRRAGRHRRPQPRDRRAGREGPRAWWTAAAAAAARPRPRLAVWVAAASSAPGIAQLGRGLAVYVAQPGYGEMFTQAGFGELVVAARAGRHPKDLAVPAELVGAVGAVGDGAAIEERLTAYGEAGADVVCLAPATADDPGAARLLRAVAGGSAQRRPKR